MYLRKIALENIKGFSSFALEFPPGREAGWHVLLGENGAGKSTVLKAIAMGLLGPKEVLRLNPDWNEWVKRGKDSARIEALLLVQANEKLPDKHARRVVITLGKLGDEAYQITNYKANLEEADPPHYGRKHFALALGPFRRFTGGDPSISDQNGRSPASPFLSLFKEGAVLSSTLDWVKNVYLHSLERDAEVDRKVLNGLEWFLGSADLLPPGITFREINAKGIFFVGSNQKPIGLHELSDGMKSVLAIALELVRQFLFVYTPEEVFIPKGPIARVRINPDKGHKEKKYPDYQPIDLEGLVLIDEIDAHLHPSWQTRIGFWLTRIFPNIQFIVTTHSPLVCRASEKGTIWRLSLPGPGEPSGEVKGIARERLLYGNVLEAFGTDLFGMETSRSKEGQLKLKRLAELNIRSLEDDLNEEEEKEHAELQSIFSKRK